MKFYNPFKAHVVRYDDGGYLVRKICPIGWKYYDSDTGHWWTSAESAHRYSKHWIAAYAMQALAAAKGATQTKSYGGV